MLQTRKNVLDKARTELADTVNETNKIYTNEELSILIQEQIEKNNQQQSLIDKQNQLIADLQNEYASKDYVEKAIEPFVPVKGCTGTGDSCTVTFKKSSDVAVCLVGTKTGGQAGVKDNIGIYYVGWHSPDGSNNVATKAIIDNSRGLKSLKAYFNEVTFTINYPSNIEVTCYNF